MSTGLGRLSLDRPESHGDLRADAILWAERRKSGPWDLPGFPTFTADGLPGNGRLSSETDGFIGVILEETEHLAALHKVVADEFDLAVEPVAEVVFQVRGGRNGEARKGIDDRQKVV